VELRFEQGSRGACPENDRKIFVKTNGYELWGYRRIGELVAEFYKNEDAIYPPSKGYDGGKYLVWFLNKIYRDGLQAALEADDMRKRNGHQTTFL